MRIRGIRFAVIGVLVFCAMAMQAHAATITVTNTNDSGPGSLRQALANANNGDKINFAVTGTITVASELVIGKNVTIAGPGANQLSIHAESLFGVPAVFHVVSGKTVTISGLTITGHGGGILNDEAILTVSNCVVTGTSPYAGLFNNASLNSGVIASVTIINSLFSENVEGIYNAFSGSEAGNCTACVTVVNSVVTGNTFGVYTAADLASTVTVLNSRFTGNAVEAIISYGNAEITVKNSTISGNFVGIETNSASVSIANTTISGNSGFGGVYAVGGDLSIVNSTISGNLANTGTGGGIYAEGLDDLSIVNSTISGNSACCDGFGGGIYNYNSSLHLTHSTITGNSAGSGGGIYNDFLLEISNTTLNAGASGTNIVNDGGTITSHGYNLSSDDGGGYLTGPADQINTDPMLGPLQDNGGPTETHALLLGSPAIDQGNSGDLFIDQRRFHRPIDIPGVPNAVGGDGSDIGAFEFGSFALQGDFNGDGFVDYVLSNVSNRATAVWYLHDNAYLSGGYGATLPIGWTVADVGDFNGDGNPDYALFNASTRQTAIWYLNNRIQVGTIYGPTLPSGWQLVATGDFNGDSKPDYVLYNAGTRQTAIWYLNNNVYVSGAYGPTIASGYGLSGVADFNSDSKPDYLLYSAGTRQTAIWYLNNNIFLGGAFGPNLPVGWTLVAP
jgi:Right handed beta helix region/FG-GAP-like repeat